MRDDINTLVFRHAFQTHTSPSRVSIPVSRRRMSRPKASVSSEAFRPPSPFPGLRTVDLFFAARCNRKRDARPTPQTPRSARRKRNDSAHPSCRAPLPMKKTSARSAPRPSSWFAARWTLPTSDRTMWCTTWGVTMDACASRRRRNEAREASGWRLTPARVRWRECASKVVRVV